MTREFPSEFSYRSFATSVRGHWRYFLDRHDQEFVGTVIATARARGIAFPRDTEFWRAQNGSDYEEPPPALRSFERYEVPFSAARMKPLPYAAKEGRANAKGIPALYMATNEATAIAEVRPGVGGVLTLARFRTTRALRLVDCAARVNHLPPPLIARALDGPALTALERELVIWSEINEAFARPVSNADDLADYVPTQVLAEAFKRAFDGILYRSGLGGPGMNVVLFRPDDADVEERSLVRVTRVKYEHERHHVLVSDLLAHAERLGFTAPAETAPTPTAPASPDTSAKPSEDASDREP